MIGNLYRGWDIDIFLEKYDLKNIRREEGLQGNMIRMQDILNPRKQKMTLRINDDSVYAFSLGMELKIDNGMFNIIIPEWCYQQICEKGFFSGGYYSGATCSDAKIIDMTGCADSNSILSYKSAKHYEKILSEIKDRVIASS